MSDHLFPVQSGRPQQHDLTPYSAVSSFNLPVTYDCNLITPVSMSSSPSGAPKTAPIFKKEAEMKFSPTSMSTAYHLFCGGDDEFAGPKFNPPMKLKDPSGILQISTADTSFPPSPYLCTSPYYGAFGVSATPQSGRTSTSSPALYTSPLLQSSGGQSSNSSDNHRSRQETTPAPSYRSSYQAPILMAPSPSGLRPATTTEHQPWRQNSFGSTSPTHSPSHSEGSPQEDSRDNTCSTPQRGRKRKDPPSEYSELLRSGEITAEEKFIFELTLLATSRIPWKQIEDRFEEQFGVRKSQSCLQMKKKRCLDRLKRKSQKLAEGENDKKDGSSESKRMLQHAGQENWQQVTVKTRKSSPENSSFKSEYDTNPRWGSSDLSVAGTSAGHTSWSNEVDETAHGSKMDYESATLMSALSNASMEEARTKALHDANARIHADQQRIMYSQHHEQQHQHRNHNVWDSGS